MKYLPLLLVLCAGCSSVSMVQEKEQGKLAPAKLPEKLWVRPFVVPRAVEFDVSRSVAKPEESPEDRMGREVAEAVVERSETLVAPGEILPVDAKVPKSGLLVEGRILRARQGSRILRTGIGFGFGGTKFETTVRVYNLDRSSTEPWLRFETTGGSNMEPGLVGALVPSPASVPIAVAVVGSAASAGAIGTKGITQDATRTGRTIVAAIHEKLAALDLTKKRAQPKRGGRLLTPAGEIPVVTLEP
jgi:hypothetical protein